MNSNLNKKIGVTAIVLIALFVGLVIGYMTGREGAEYNHGDKMGNWSMDSDNGTMENSDMNQTVDENNGATATTTTSTTAGLGERCGGNMTTAKVCSVGLHCAPTPGSHLPFGDVGGTCVSN